MIPVLHIVADTYEAVAGYERDANLNNVSCNIVTPSSTAASVASSVLTSL